MRARAISRAGAIARRSRFRRDWIGSSHLASENMNDLIKYHQRASYEEENTATNLVVIWISFRVVSAVVSARITRLHPRFRFDIIRITTRRSRSLRRSPTEDQIVQPAYHTTRRSPIREEGKEKDELRG